MRCILLGALGLLFAACNSSPTKAPSGSSGTAGATTATNGSSAGSGSGTGSTAASGGGPTADVHFIGRFDTKDPAGPRFAWPGSAILTRFSGTGIDVTLADQGSNFLAVVVDGAAPTVLATSAAQQTYTLASGLPDGEHTLLIEKRTESFVGTVQFLGFVPAKGGALVPTPAPYTRSMELVGDSITCGYGNEGNGPGCSFSADTENEYMAYGAIAARALHAAHTAICYSGIGIYRDYTGSTRDQMPVRFARTLADDPASRWDFSVTPDVVVINLGTNDFGQGDPGQPFADAFAAFVQKVRGHYPGAHIVCAVGSMLSDGYPPGAMHLTKATQYVQGVVAARNQAGDTKVSFADLGEQDPADGYGCNYHPSIATDQKMAARLVTAIKAVTGW